MEGHGREEVDQEYCIYQNRRVRIDDLPLNPDAASFIREGRIVLRPDSEQDVFPIVKASLSGKAHRFRKR